MDIVSSLKAFLRVAETGSFSAAAVNLGLTQPAVSRQVSALEAHLNMRLLHRTTSALALTSEGEQTIPMALRVIEAVDALGDGQESASRTVSGKVKLSMPAPLGLYISDRLPQFLDSYPRLAVELLLREEASDLVGEGIDLEIRLGQVTDNNLVCRRIGWTTAFLVAAPDYLQNRPEPGIPADIGGHNCICYNRAGDNTTWSFSNGAGEVCVRPARRLIASNSMAVHRAVLSGGGLAVLSHILTGADIQAGRLKKLMPEYPPTRLPINVVYLSRRNLPLRVRVTLDFLVSVVRDDPCMTSAIYEG